MKQKILSILLCTILVFSMTGCESQNKERNNNLKDSNIQNNEIDTSTMTNE